MSKKEGNTYTIKFSSFHTYKVDTHNEQMKLYIIYISYFVADFSDAHEQGSN